eukprot:143094-Ditylum_brightwellii.AAC.1
MQTDKAKSNSGYTIIVLFLKCAVSSSHAIICMTNKRCTERIYFFLGSVQLWKRSNTCVNSSSSNAQLLTSTDPVGLLDFLATFHTSSQQGIKKKVPSYSTQGRRIARMLGCLQ